MSSTPYRTQALSDTAHPGHQSYPAGTGAVAVLVATALVVLAQLYAAIPLLAPVGQALAVDVTFALSTSFSLSYALGFVLWGALADHYGRRPTLLAGLGLLVVATAACAFASSTSALAVLRGVQGLAAASFAPVALAYLSEALPPARRPAAIGAMSTAFLVAGIVGQVGAEAISLYWGWAWVFSISAVLLGVSWLAIMTVVRELKRPAASGGLVGRFVAIARVAVTPSVLCLCAAHITLLLSFVAMYTALGPHLETYGMESSQVIWIRLVALPGMFAALAVGPLSRRWGVAGIARAGYVLAATGLGIQAVLSHSLTGVAAASIVFVTGVALAVPTMITLFGQAAAPHRAGGMAINGLVLFTGASLGPLLASTSLSFPALMLVLAGMLVMAAVCVTIFTHLRTTGDPS